MRMPTLVVSDPPHGEVDLEAAGKLLDLDGFATRLKASFQAPEVMFASDAESAASFASSLRGAGFDVVVLGGGTLCDPPWPDPVSTLAFDVSFLSATTRGEVIRVPYDAEVVGVHCQPPDYRTMRPSEDLERAIASEHGPTIAEAMQLTSILDLYFREEGSLRRVTLVPDRLKLEPAQLLKEIGRRFKHLELDARLVGVRPRAPFGTGKGFDGSERRRYSFGTLMLREVLESIAPELRAVPQYEFGSRLAYALSPLGAEAARS
jgi:hypothetical protein